MYAVYHPKKTKENRYDRVIYDLEEILFQDERDISQLQDSDGIDIKQKPLDVVFEIFRKRGGAGFKIPQSIMNYLIKNVLKKKDYCLMGGGGFLDILLWMFKDGEYVATKKQKKSFQSVIRRVVLQYDIFSYNKPTEETFGVWFFIEELNEFTGSCGLYVQLLRILYDNRAKYMFNSFPELETLHALLYDQIQKVEIEELMSFKDIFIHGVVFDTLNGICPENEEWLQWYVEEGVNDFSISANLEFLQSLFIKNIKQMGIFIGNSHILRYLLNKNTTLDGVSPLTLWHMIYKYPHVFNRHIKPTHLSKVNSFISGLLFQNLYPTNLKLATYFILMGKNFNVIDNFDNTVEEHITVLQNIKEYTIIFRRENKFILEICKIINQYAESNEVIAHCVIMNYSDIYDKLISKINNRLGIEQ
jgi:hypothetical protein